VLQCVVVRCSVFSRLLNDIATTTTRTSRIECVTVCCSVLQCVAACCSALQCVAVCRGVLQYVARCVQCIIEWECDDDCLHLTD